MSDWDIMYTQMPTIQLLLFKICSHPLYVDSSCRCTGLDLPTTIVMNHLPSQINFESLTLCDSSPSRWISFIESRWVSDLLHYPLKFNPTTFHLSAVLYGHSALNNVVLNNPDHGWMCSCTVHESISHRLIWYFSPLHLPGYTVWDVNV